VFDLVSVLWAVIGAVCVAAGVALLLVKPSRY